MAVRRFASFNPHTHAGCDQCARSIIEPGGGFNPHTHAGCDIKLMLSVRACMCFNPHTHAGCDSYWCNLHIRTKVSIHTPTQGVTNRLSLLYRQNPVSIHTPTQGVTQFWYSMHSSFQSFNPHTHAGCDKQY